MLENLLPRRQHASYAICIPFLPCSRAELAARRFANGLHYALYNRGEPQRIEPSFPVASQEINMLMPLLLDAINASEALAAGIAAVHFLSTQAGDMLITLIYSAALRPDWRAAALATHSRPLS